MIGSHRRPNRQLSRRDGPGNSSRTDNKCCASLTGPQLQTHPRSSSVSRHVWTKIKREELRKERTKSLLGVGRVVVQTVSALLTLVGQGSSGLEMVQLRERHMQDVDARCASGQGEGSHESEPSTLFASHS